MLQVPVSRASSSCGCDGNLMILCLMCCSLRAATRVRMCWGPRLVANTCKRQVTAAAGYIHTHPSTALVAVRGYFHQHVQAADAHQRLMPQQAMDHTAEVAPAESCSLHAVRHHIARRHSWKQSSAPLTVTPAFMPSPSASSPSVSPFLLPAQAASRGCICPGSPAPTQGCAQQQQCLGGRAPGSRTHS